MGEAFFRALTGKLKPSVGLLNVGAEELKGHDTVRSAAALLRRADAEMAFHGFVEGNDISEGVVVFLSGTYYIVWYSYNPLYIV